MEQQANRSELARHRDYLIPKNTRYKNQSEDNQNQHLNTSKVLEDNGSHTSTELTEYPDDEEDEEENELTLEEMRYSDARMGVCSVCHYSIRGSGASLSEFDKALLCSNGHLLCHRCVQRFSFSSDTCCVLCAAWDSQQSLSSNSRASSIKSIKQKKRYPTTSHTRQRSRSKEMGHYTTTINEAHANIDSHYNTGINYAEDSLGDNWEENEHDDATYEDGAKEKSLNENKQRSYCSISHESHHAINMQINAQMLSECSRRPIQCPRLDCAVNVAFSALTNHFIFDHPEVPILNVDPGEKSTLVVNFDGLLYDSSRCLALLLVSNKLSGPAAKQFNGNHIHPRYKNRLPLPILAARLHCSASYDNSVHQAGEGGHDDRGDVVIAWVAGLDIGNTTTGALRCSIQSYRFINEYKNFKYAFIIQAIDSIDSEAFRSLTYTGPINSLRTAQKPREVFLIGDCVILHDGFINHITSGCENLNVNVTIY